MSYHESQASTSMASNALPIDVFLPTRVQLAAAKAQQSSVQLDAVSYPNNPRLRTCRRSPSFLSAAALSRRASTSCSSTDSVTPARADDSALCAEATACSKGVFVGIVSAQPWVLCWPAGVGFTCRPQQAHSQSTRYLYASRLSDCLHTSTKTAPLPQLGQ